MSVDQTFINHKTVQRLIDEVKTFASNTPPGMIGGPLNDDVSNWQVIIEGPAGTPYEKGRFPIEIVFPGNYPFRPPAIKFLCKIYHCNVDEEGAICIGILKQEAWKPTTKIVEVLKEIQSLLKLPNPDDPLSIEIAKQYQTDQAAHNKTAKEWTKKFAK